MPDALHKLGLPLGPLGNSASSTEGILKIWKCARAYQDANWWFVLFVFELTYLGLKSFAIPATWALCIVAGAIFPLPLAQASS